MIEKLYLFSQEQASFEFSRKLYGVKL